MILTINLYNFHYQIYNDVDDAKVRILFEITKSFDKNLSFINIF